MKRIVLLSLALLASGMLHAQQDKGGITAEMLQQIRTGESKSAAERAARNAWP
jgi:hypothetical protein